MLRSSFSSFTTAQLAIRANQNALSIVGQNMANVKTNGYTRQRLDQVSLNMKNISSMYESVPDAHIGYGVEVTGVSQIRDPFLDLRYRAELGNLGTYDQRLSVLNELSTILDETTKTALDNQFNDLSTQLKNLQNQHIGDEGFDNMVRSSAKTLTDMFNLYSNQLKEVQSNLESDLKEDVLEINDLLDQIQKLNIGIKNSQVHGNPSLELQDQRNLLIDQLSTYGNVKVSHSTDVTMTGAAVDILKIDMVSSDGITSIPLIDDTKPPAKFLLDTSSPYSLTVDDASGVTHTDFSSDKGSLKTALGMLNDGGEFGGTNHANRGIAYYGKMLDTFAATFAETMNALNVSTATKPPNDKPGDLFESVDGNPITAANITVSKKWLNGEVRIVASQDPNAGSDESSNIQNMLAAITDKRDFKATDPSNPAGTITVFNGSFQECFGNMVTVLSSDSKSTKTTLDNYTTIANGIADSKDSVSGVNVDEEAMNMMQYNNALNAASRLMTTLDEALNTIINSMGVVGR